MSIVIIPFFLFFFMILCVRLNMVIWVCTQVSITHVPIQSSFISLYLRDDS